MGMKSKAESEVFDIVVASNTNMESIRSGQEFFLETKDLIRSLKENKTVLKKNTQTSKKARLWTGTIKISLRFNEKNEL